MLFNSLAFALFLPIVFAIYWSIPARQIKWQNVVVLISSYVFYGWWDWRFLGLILFSSLVDFTIGQRIAKASNPSAKKMLLGISLSVNLGLLAYFKYLNFFIESFVSAFDSVGIAMNVSSLHIILPVGISFYTFQTLSYSIDIYRGQLEPSRNLVSFLAFVSFFPQLVAGPIERASNLMPQFARERKFDYQEAVLGMRQILWGLFKKVVIADNCAMLVDQIFSTYDTQPGNMLIVGAVLFAFQIYGDFSGYSDIAIGVSRLFGFNLMTNFRTPYFSRDIAEFWRRWHISLSTWFRDYLYIPLGGSRGGQKMRIRNTMIIFLVSGFWHGANWTFVIWGGLNALFFLPLLLGGQNRSNLNTVAEGRTFPTFTELRQVLATFVLTCLAWVFFRAESLEQALGYLQGIFSQAWSLDPMWLVVHAPLVVSILVLLGLDWHNRTRDVPLNLKGRPLSRKLVYIALGLSVFLLSPGQEVSFIYFQF